MPRAVWARLAAPFPASASTWTLREVSPDRQRARVAPRLTAEALRARLDEAVTPQRWSCQLVPALDGALVCNLTVEGVTRFAVVERLPGGVHGSELASAAALADSALAACAEQFGMRADGAEGWAPHDPETGDVLIEELEAGPSGDDLGAVPDSAGPLTAAPPLLPDTEPTAAALEPAEERPEAHVVIDRLVDRLKSEGLGGQAAKLVVRYGGYGASPEESRELYGKLRSLLVGKAAVER